MIGEVSWPAIEELEKLPKLKRLHLNKLNLTSLEKPSKMSRLHPLFEKLDAFYIVDSHVDDDENGCAYLVSPQSARYIDLGNKCGLTKLEVPGHLFVCQEFKSYASVQSLILDWSPECKFDEPTGLTPRWFAQFPNVTAVSDNCSSSLVYWMKGNSGLERLSAPLPVPSKSNPMAPSLWSKSYHLKWVRVNTDVIYRASPVLETQRFLIDDHLSKLGTSKTLLAFELSDKARHTSLSKLANVHFPEWCCDLKYLILYDSLVSKDEISGSDPAISKVVSKFPNLELFCFRLDGYNYTGATAKLLVDHLLSLNCNVKCWSFFYYPHPSAMSSVGAKICAQFQQALVGSDWTVQQARFEPEISLWRNNAPTPPWVLAQRAVGRLPFGTHSFRSDKFFSAPGVFNEL